MSSKGKEVPGGIFILPAALQVQSNDPPIIRALKLQETMRQYAAACFPDADSGRMMWDWYSLADRSSKEINSALACGMAEVLRHFLPLQVNMPGGRKTIFVPLDQITQGEDKNGATPLPSVNQLEQPASVDAAAAAR